MDTQAQTSTTYDVVIIGGGAAGLSAALYASRRALNVLLISKDLGGQAARTPEIENYPGLPLMDGAEIMMLFRNQAEKFGAKIEFTEAQKIEQQSDGAFLVQTPKTNYQATAVILAFGLTPRDMGVKGEAEFKGKGVSYCATCDAPFFKGKTVAVAGGGPGALDAAELLSRMCPKVYMIHQGATLVGNLNLKERVQGAKNIEVFLQHKVVEVQGTDRVNALKITHTKEQTEKMLEVEGVFVELGYVVRSDWVQNLVDLDPRRQIIVNANCETKTAGVFAAGDVTTISYKQVVISAGEGAKAALAAYKYIQTTKGKPPVVPPDWGLTK